ncbi:hypothetical protein ACIGO8_10850 [Streptomyces sp. NPDC053493]|uniref:hypothetical protein n=1 Tax=Streptomyces sp. NPDC053493 TaxID=3365705 RepID=UPI0037D047EA
MSGSPMYTSVGFDPGLMALGLAVRATRSAARRSREAERQREREALAAERARQLAERQARARAAAEHRRAELAQRRRVRQDAHAARLREDQGRADSRRLDEVEGLLRPLREAPDRLAELAVFEARLAELRGALGGPAAAGGLGAAVEELRGRVVTVVEATAGASAAAAARPDPYAVVRELRDRLAALGADGAALDAAGATECAELIGRLGAVAAEPGAEVGFEALLGTVEHALARHADTVARAAEQAAARAEEAEEAAARAAEEESARQEAERAALAEALDRFGVVEESARSAVRDAEELAAPDLAAEAGEALRAAVAALDAGAAAAALDAVAALEVLLPSVEERLDELQLAHARRTELAGVLKDAMTDAGLDFTGGEERGGSLVLSFERPSGAVYEATVETEADGGHLLTYHVDGEPDMSLRPAAEDGAVCAPEELLNLVHRALDGTGFTPGELTWDGKPPRSTARSLPGTEERRAR